MSLDTTNPPLPPNAAQETGGNLDAIASAQKFDLPETLGQMLVELKVMNQLIAEAFGLEGLPEELRHEYSQR